MIDKTNFNEIKNLFYDKEFLENKINLQKNLKQYDILPYQNDKFHILYNPVTNNPDLSLIRKLINIDSTVEKCENIGENVCENSCSKLNPNLVSINLDKVRQLGIDGKDVVVAVVDSGIIYNHPDLDKDRIIFYKDFSGESNENNPKDLLGHGTHVASLIGGSGKMSNGYNQGVAPGVKFVILRITSVSEIIKALEWIKENGKKYNIKVVNLSIGVDPKTGYLNDAIAKLANDLAQDYTVVAAAGNDYANETIDSPGMAPDVITVGGLDTKNTCDVSDDTIYDASSKGPSPFDLLDKPDVIAPAKLLAGARVPGSVFDPYKNSKQNIYNNDIKVNLNSNKNQFYQDNKVNILDTNINNVNDIWQGQYYINLSGTSGATAIVSGIAALIYQVLPNATPKLVKEIIIKTAHKVKDPQTNQEYDKYTQGSGLVDAYNAVKYAMTLKNNDTNLA
jgi:serine protease AprX